MMLRVFLLLSLITVTGCAGVQVVHEKVRSPIDITKKYMVFPLKDPSFGTRTFSGVGSRFTNKFILSCSRYGLEVVPVSNNIYQSTKDINILDALSYAKDNDIDYIITGQVTQWINRATYWTGKRDIAAFSIFVRNTNSGNIIFSSEVQEYSNVFWSGTPDDFVDNLTKIMARKLIGTPALIIRQ